MKKVILFLALEVIMEIFFENLGFNEFCGENGISHNFAALRTPQQNGVVERRNRTLEEMARRMLCENNLPKSDERKLLMNFLEKKSLTLAIFILLVVNILF